MSTEEMMLRILQAYDVHTIYPSLDTPYSKNYSNINFAAEGLDIHTIGGIVSERQEQINHVDALIERTETILIQLREKRKKLVSSKKVHECFLTHIRRLPSEILGEIFLQCLPPRGHVRPLRKDAPLLLTQVCRRWREIALDTPRLWCSLSVLCRSRVLRSRRGERQREWKPHLPFYDDWLKRAKCCPLSLTIDISEPRNTDNGADEEQEAAIDLFRLHTSRSSELSLSFDVAECLSLLLQDVPILEHLSLEGNMNKFPTISIVQPQPRLHTLIICLPELAGTVVIFSAFNPGWTNLTHLAMVLQSSQDNMFLMLLQICPNLEHLMFSPTNIPMHDNPVLLTLPKLRVLDLKDAAINNSLTDRLTLPNMCSLQVDSHAPFDANSFRDTSLPEEDPLHESRHRTFNFTLSSISGTRHLLTLFNPDWLNITHLTLHIETDDILLQIIQLCPNLEEASIRIGGHCYHWEPPPVPFVHYRLYSLTLSDLRWPLNNLLALFTLPSLCHLKITHLEKPRWPHGQFKRLFSRSRFLLERLIIEGVTMHNIDKNTFKKLLPTLRHVKIRSRVRSGDETPSDSDSDSE